LHPILFHLGSIAIPTQGMLAAFGLLGGLQLSCRLAPLHGLDPDRIWSLGLTGLATLFLGERMLVIVFNLHDFVAHPVWMLGLTVVRDERYFLGGALLAICACIGYILAWRLDLRAVLDALAPGAGLALASLSLGALAAGADFGRPTSTRWGIVYTSPLAARAAGTPLGIPLVPVALYAALLYLGISALAVWLLRPAQHPRAQPSHIELDGRPAPGSGTTPGELQPGDVAALWLFASGLGTVLLGQLRYRLPGEALLAGAFTPSQVLGILSVFAAAWLRLRWGDSQTMAQ